MRAVSILCLIAAFNCAAAVPSCTYPHTNQHDVTRSPAPDRGYFLTFWNGISHFLARLLAPSDEPASSNAQHHRVSSGPGLSDSRYGDELLLRFNISTEAEAYSLADASNTLFLDVWEHTREWIDIRVAQDVLPSLLGLLPSSLQHSHALLMSGSDMVDAIDASSPRGFTPSSFDGIKGFTSFTRRAGGTETDIFFDDYRPLSVMLPWMQLMQSIYSTHVSYISIGQSYEGRDIPALRVGAPPAVAEEPLKLRKTILITGGLHAREWISTSTVLYAAYSMITSYGKSRGVTKLLEQFDWVFIPTLNPDGYQYTFDGDRLWRKNRQATSLRFCRGLDLDRTFSFQWDGERTSDNPCSEGFAGEAPFQGVEARVFADWANNETEHNDVEFVGLLDLHSYSQQILYPYSYSCHSSPPTLEDLEELGQGLAKAIRGSSHQNYKVISACEGNAAIWKNPMPWIGGGGGSLLDYFYNVFKIRHAYQIKLRDKGSYGFLLPKQYILPTGKEAVRAVEYFGKAMASAFYSEGDAQWSASVDLQQFTAQELLA